MKKLDKLIIGIIMITTVVMAMSSCICGGQKENHCETVEERDNCEKGCKDE